MSLALDATHERESVDQFEFSSSCELVKLLIEAFFPSFLPVVASERRHKIATHLEGSVAVIDGSTGHVAFQKDARCRDNVKPVLEVGWEPCSTLSKPDLPTLLVLFHLAHHINEGSCSIDACDLQVKLLLLELVAEKACASATVEHDRVSLDLRDALFFGQALNFVNDVVGFVEVDTDGPLVVALGRDSVVEVADFVWLGVVDGELFDSLVANGGSLFSLFMEVNLLNFDHGSDL